ncbi:efflux transporter outer membrane subunit [Oleiharenicola lentus]|uniref:efflux transporter outer membrane subunit n=1 Tax=Oleiharenicola lentus TaxID=2508720 RepID=UPI003F675C00
MQSAFTKTFSIACLLVLVAGCAVGPDYRAPQPATPAAFIEPGPWKSAAPRDALPKGDWWTLFGDAELNRLETAATAASPTIAAALARRDQARALSRSGRADLFPSATVNASAERSRTPPNARTGAPAFTDNNFRLPLDLAYELDLWGRVRRSVEATDARAEASEADYHNVLLSVQTEVARTYFELRAVDAEYTLLTRTVESRRESLEIVTRRLELGAGAELDVQLARTELATAEGDRLSLEQDRAALRHSLAVLLGQMPETFSIAPAASLAGTAPEIPVGLPSELLERRPDIASAERSLAAANAGIGAAKAAFFPSLTLFASGGYQSASTDTLTQWDNRQWSFGPGVSLPIFQGGRNTANYRRAQAFHAEALADYQSTVLNAFREVETALSDLRLLTERDALQGRARTSSHEAASLLRQRFEAGQLGYLDVIDAERTAITNERRLVLIRGQNLSATVALIKALGGGW